MTSSEPADKTSPAEAHRILAGSDELPLARLRRRAQTATTGMAAIYGKWPGDETDEEFAELIAELD